MNPIAPAGLRVERDGSVVRLAGAFNFVCWWDFSAAETDTIVQRQAAHFHALDQSLMWRVHGHDGPDTLPAALADAGFKAGAPGMLMALPATHDLPEKPGIAVWRVTGRQGISDYLAVDATAFPDDDGDWQESHFLSRLDDDTLGLFVAYIDGKPCGAARIELTPGAGFALLYGGGVVPEARGRGLYVALTAARASLARAHGVDYLVTEATAATSYPILDRLGFVTLTSETTWVLPSSNSAKPS